LPQGLECAVPTGGPRKGCSLRGGVGQGVRPRRLLPGPRRHQAAGLSTPAERPGPCGTLLETAMSSAFWRWSELDRTSYPEVRDRIVQYEQDPAGHQPRSYPGYPRWLLPRLRPRLWPPLDRVLFARRSPRALGVELPSRRLLGRLLLFA